MRVEHIADGVTVYLGDCREILPTLPQSDAVVTDPPYGNDYGRAGGFSASHGWHNNREKVEWDRDRPTKELFDLILKTGRVQIIWGGNYFTDYLPPTMQWLVWDKVQREFSLADCELAWCSQRKASRVFSYARGNESGFAPRGADAPNSHPTQKPVMLMKWCLERIPECTHICDPFMGSGTTGVACIRLGRQFTGIEIEEKYFETACRRLVEATKQGDLFVGKHESVQLEWHEMWAKPFDRPELLG